ncbi:hypothetical protein FQR65_LT09914 [Abscondita terminalis]|nr:hypothetical protein FQR65_LT09914 [Abscondita terminalis]
MYVLFAPDEYPLEEENAYSFGNQITLFPPTPKISHQDLSSFLILSVVEDLKLGLDERKTFSPTEQALLSALMEKFKDTFRLNEEADPCGKFQIETDDAQLVITPPHCTLNHEKSLLCQKVDKLVRLHIVQEYHSPQAAPMNTSANLKILCLLAVSVTIKPFSKVMADWTQYDKRDNLKNTYEYGYEIEDIKTNNFQFKNEKRELDGSVSGSYGYLAYDGSIHLVHYVADKNGYRAKVENGLKDKNLNQRGYSKQLIDILQSKDLYKKQSMFEQRVRPFDLLTEEEKITFKTKINN